MNVDVKFGKDTCLQGDESEDVWLMQRGLAGRLTESAKSAPRFRTWYIDHESMRHCFDSRIWSLEGGSHEWESQLRQLWYDLIDASQPLRVVMVTPEPLQDNAEPLIAGHLILCEGSDAYAAILLTSPIVQGVRSSPLVFAVSTFRLVTGQYLIRLAGMTQLCDQTLCAVWLHPHRLALHASATMYDGACVQIYISPSHDVCCDSPQFDAAVTVTGRWWQK